MTATTSSPSLARQRVGRQIARWVSVGLILAVSALSYRSIGDLIGMGSAVSHSQEVMVEVRQVFSLLKDAETGQRGYLITGDRDFLAPYDRAVEAIPQGLDHLRALMVDN